MSTISINQPQHSNITQGHPNTSSKIISAYIRLNNKKAYLIKLNSKINLEQLYKIISYHLKVETKDIVVITKGKILHQKFTANNHLNNQSNFIKNQPKSQIYQAQTSQVQQEKDNAVSNDINHPTNKSQAFMQQIITQSNKSNITANNLNKIQIIVDEKQIFHAILYPNILNFKFLRFKIKQMIKVLSSSSAANQQMQEKLSHKNSSSNTLMMANDQIYGLLDKNNSLATTGDFQKLIKNNSNMSQQQVKASQTSGRTSVNRLGAKSFTYTYILDNIDKTITIKQLIISKFNQVQIPLISNPVIQSFIQKVAPGSQTQNQPNQQSSLPPFISFGKLNEILKNSAVIVYTGRILSAYKTLEQEFVQNDAEVIVTFRKALKMQKLREQFGQKSKIVEQNSHNKQLNAIKEQTSVSQQNHQVEGYTQLQSFKADCIVIKQYQTQEQQKQQQHYFEQQKVQQQNIQITKQQNPKPAIIEAAQTQDNNQNKPAVQEHQKQQQNDQTNEGMLSPIYPRKHHLQQICHQQTDQKQLVHEQQQQQQQNQSPQQEQHLHNKDQPINNNNQHQLTQTIHYPQSHHHSRPYKMSVDSQQLIQLLSLNPNHHKDINKLQKQQEELNNLLYLQPLQQKLNSQNYDQEEQQQLGNRDNNKVKQQNQGKEQCIHYQQKQQKQVKQQENIHKQAEEFAQQLLTLQFQHLKHEIKVQQQLKQKQLEQHKKGQQQNIVQLNSDNAENVDVNQLKNNKQSQNKQFQQNNQQYHQQQYKQKHSFVQKQNNLIENQQKKLIENQQQQQQIITDNQHQQDNIITDQVNHIQIDNHNNTNNSQPQPQKLQSSNYNNYSNKQNLSSQQVQQGQQVQQVQQQVQKLQNSYQNDNPNNTTTNQNIENDLSINYKPPQMIQNYYNSNNKSTIQQEILEEQQTIRQVDNSQYKQLKENNQQQQQLLILQQTKVQQQQHQLNQQDQQLIQNLQQQHQINHQPSQQQLQQPQQNNYQFKSLIKTKQQQKVSYLVLQSYQPKPKLNKVNIIDGLIGELIFIDYDQQREVETDDPVKGRYVDEKEDHNQQLFHQGNKQELQEKTPSLKTQNSLIERVQGIPSVIKNQLASVSPIQGNTQLTEQNNFENVNLTQNNQLKNYSQTNANNLLIASTASPIEHMMISSIQLQNDKQYKQELSKRQINNYLESYNGNLLEISPLRDSLGPGSSILKETDQIVEIQRIQKAESKQYDLAQQKKNHKIEKSQDKQNQEIGQQQVQQQDFNEVEDENQYQREQGQQEDEQEAFSQQLFQQEQVQPKVKFTQGDLLYTVELEITPKPKLIDAIAYDYHDLLCKNLEQFVQIFGNIIPQDTQNTNMQPFGQHQKRFSFIIQ